MIFRELPLDDVYLTYTGRSFEEAERSHVEDSEEGSR